VYICINVKNPFYLVEGISQYPAPESNRHIRRYWCLRPTRLPIPPAGLAVSLFDVANIGDVLGFPKNIFVVFTN
jgi:hypothetical protein